MIRNYNGLERGTVFVSVLVVAVLLVGTSAGAAQSVPPEKFNETYGGDDSDAALSVVETSDGGFALAGETQSLSTGGGFDADAWLVKTDSDGNEVFNKTYGGDGFDRVLSAVETSEGGFALAGETAGDTGASDAWLIKTDSDGNEVFNKTYGGDGFDLTWSVVETSEGGFALAGLSESSSTGGIDSNAWLIKTDPDGNEVFNKTYGGDDSEVAWSVVETSDGGFALGGTKSFGVGESDAWLIKTDSDGNEVFNKTYGGDGFSRALSVLETSDGGFAIAGDTDSDGAGSEDAWLRKTDSDGNEVFSKTYGGDALDVAWSVIETSDGGFALGGFTESFGAGSEDAWLIRTDSKGNEVFNKTYGGGNTDAVVSVIETSDRGLALAGGTESFGLDNFDAWLINLSGLGEIPPLSIESPDRALSDGEFEFGVTMRDSSVGEVAVESDDFGVELSVIDDAGDSTGAQTETNVEFIDIDGETSTYTLRVNVTGGSEGDTGTINAATGGNIGDSGVDAQNSTTFTLVDVPPSPVEGVSDELWTVVTMDDDEDGLSLSDLGNAIQEYQKNPSDADVGGVSIGLSELGSLIQYYRTEVV